MLSWYIDAYFLSNGELNDVDLAPHKKGELIFPVNNWNTEDKLNIQFFQNDTFLIDEYKLQIGVRTVELPNCENGKLTVVKGDNTTSISGKNFSVDLNEKTGMLENWKVEGKLLIKSGPYLNLKIPGARVQYSTLKMKDYAVKWKCQNINLIEKNGIATIAVKGVYDDAVDFSYSAKIDENGLFTIAYQAKNITQGKTIQEAGLKFLVGNLFETLEWNRNAYFTAYPHNHLGSPAGKIKLNDKPGMIYREKPNHPWEMDTKGFYYFGLKEELPYTNIVRELKENIFSYSLKTTDAKIEVLSNGKQAARFDKINGQNTLIVNEEWDYNSLLWGNYQKQIKLNGEFNGKVTLRLH